METPYKLDVEITKKWVGLYPIDDSTINNIIDYCCDKVWNYICDNSTINWRVKAENLSPYRIEQLQRAYKSECESYLANGGDYKDTPNVVNGVVSNIRAEDVSVAPQTLKILEASGFLYRGLY